MKNRIILCTFFVLPLLSNAHLQNVDFEERENPFTEILNKPINCTWNNRYLVDHSRNFYSPIFNEQN